MNKFISTLVMASVVLVTSNNSILKKDGDKMTVVKQGVEYSQPMQSSQPVKSNWSNGKMIERSYARSAIKTYTMPRPVDREVDR